MANAGHQELDLAQLLGFSEKNSAKPTSRQELTTSRRSLGRRPPSKSSWRSKRRSREGSSLRSWALVPKAVPTEGGNAPSEPRCAVCQRANHPSRATFPLARWGSEQADSRRRHRREQPGLGFRARSWVRPQRYRGSEVAELKSRLPAEVPLVVPDPGGRIVIGLLCRPLREPSLRNEQRAWIDAWRWCHDPRLDEPESRSVTVWSAELASISRSIATTRRRGAMSISGRSAKGSIRDARRALVVDDELGGARVARHADDNATRRGNLAAGV